MTLLTLLLTFMQLGAFSVGGGYAAMPLIESLTVAQHGWLTAAEFADLVTIAEMTPGPIAINAATFVGMRVAGVSGALAAMLGCVLPSLVIVSLLAWAYNRGRSGLMMQSVLASMRPVVVALIASAAVTLTRVACLRGDTIRWMGVLLFIAALVALRRWKVSPILAMALCGACGLALHALGMA